MPKGKLPPASRTSSSRIGVSNRKNPSRSPKTNAGGHDKIDSNASSAAGNIGHNTGSAGNTIPNIKEMERGSMFRALTKAIIATNTAGLAVAGKSSPGIRVVQSVRRPTPKE